MNLARKIKDLIKMNDIFYSSELLRYQKQNQFQTMTGGILSLAIWITIAVSFTSMVLDTFQMTDIASSTTIQKLNDPPNTVIRTGPQSKFMFGIRITDLMGDMVNLNSQKRYFDVSFTTASFSAGNMIGYNFHLLEQCRKEHWSDFAQILSNFNKLQMDDWLCPPINTVFNLSGLYTSSFSQTASFAVTECNNLTNSYSICASPDQIDEYFFNKTNFSFNLYFTNPIINPSKPDYIDYYLQQNANAIFSKSLGSLTQIFLADYNIESDNSIWPFITSTIDKGTILDGNILNRPFIMGPNSQYFLSLTIFKSSSFYIIQRQVRKISSVFSYIGGFFGAITAALFIIRTYTDSAFQFSLLNTLFSSLEDQKVKEKQEEEQSFHFLKFLGMKCYSVLKKFGLSKEWLQMNKLIEGQEQVKNHLDIASLLRRIIILQDLFTFVLEDYQLQGIKLQRNKTLEFARELRKNFSAQQTSRMRQEKVKVHYQGSSLPADTMNKADQKSSNPLVIEIRRENSHLPQQRKLDGQMGDIQCIEFPNPQNIPVIYVDQYSVSDRHQSDQQKKNIEHLINLHNSTAENQISMKIWKKIPQQFKRKIPNYKQSTIFQ